VGVVTAAPAALLLKSGQSLRLLGFVLGTSAQWSTGVPVATDVEVPPPGVPAEQAFHLYVYFQTSV
jgi:hypothetical protein